MIDVKVAVFFNVLNATIPLTSTLGNEYPSSNETSKKNGTVRGDCIACDALLRLFAEISNPEQSAVECRMHFTADFSRFEFFSNNFDWVSNIV